MLGNKKQIFLEKRRLLLFRELHSALSHASRSFQCVIFFMKTLLIVDLSEKGKGIK